MELNMTNCEERLKLEYMTGVHDGNDWQQYYMPQGFSAAFGQTDRNIYGNLHPSNAIFSYASMLPQNGFGVATEHCNTNRLKLASSEFPAFFPTSACSYAANSEDNAGMNYQTNLLALQSSTNYSPHKQDVWNPASQIFAEKQAFVPHRSKMVATHLPQAPSAEVSNGDKSLPSEQKTRSGHELPTHRCEECDRGYHTTRSLAVHKRSHNGVKPYNCKVCEKKFNQWNVWSMHMKVHNGTKDFVCPICNKAFSQSGHLFTHMQGHNNIKKHVCETCNKRFIGKGDLIRHQRSHTGEKPFSCTQCTRRFSRNESLKYHLFLHDDVRPHNCPLCAKNYTKISTLKTHFKKVHNVGDLDSYVLKGDGHGNKNTKNRANKTRMPQQ